MPSDDRESRLKAVRNAIAITRMEGGEPSARVKELLDAWVDGRITTAEMRQAIRDPSWAAAEGDRVMTDEDSDFEIVEPAPVPEREEVVACWGDDCNGNFSTNMGGTCRSMPAVACACMREYHGWKLA